MSNFRFILRSFQNTRDNERFPIQAFSIYNHKIEGTSSMPIGVRGFAVQIGWWRWGVSATLMWSSKRLSWRASK